MKHKCFVILTLNFASVFLNSKAASCSVITVHGNQSDSAGTSSRQGLADHFNDDEFHIKCVDFIRSSNKSSFQVNSSFVPIRSRNTAKLKVTITTVFTYDRRYMIEPFARQWRGPIIFLLYGTSTEAENIQMLFRTSSLLRQRHDIGVIYVQKQPFAKYFPLNYLRNLARQYVLTDFVLPLDVDLLLNRDSYSIVLRLLKSYQAKQNCIKITYVVPGLRTASLSRKNVLKNFPQSKAEVISKWKTEYFPFGSQAPCSGYGQTNFSRWLTAKEVYKVRWRYRFEPSLIFSTHCLVRFEETFVGYGYDKLTLAVNMAQYNFTFFVIPDVFTVHVPHSVGWLKQRRQYNATENRCDRTIKSKFFAKFDRWASHCSSKLL